MASAADAREVVVSFWVTVNEGDYDKVTDLFSEDCVVTFPGWEQTYSGKADCAGFFKRFIMEKDVTETELSFFQGYHPGGEDDGSHSQIVNWVSEEGTAKSGEQYKVNYAAKFDIQKQGKIGVVDIVIDAASIKRIFG